MENINLEDTHFIESIPQAPQLVKKPKIILRILWLFLLAVLIGISALIIIQLSKKITINNSTEKDVGSSIETREKESPFSDIAKTTVPTQTPPTADFGNIKILNVAYFPEKKGILDTTNAIADKYGEYNMSIEQVRAKVKSLIPQVIKVLEDGSAFQAYKNLNSKPFLTYSEVSYLEFLEATPLLNVTSGALPIPDYMKIMERINVCDYIDNKGVKEVWLWTYGGAGKGGWESNFSSKYGDISNSDQNPNDLPPCSHTYTVYDYNYGRSVSEAVEDHIHQYERLFRYVDNELFWEKFVGYFPGGWDPNNTVVGINRRCGWSHYPPNGEKDYDWENKTYVKTDCEDWRPEGYGTTITINCEKWSCSSVKFFEWWMQNIPGQNNPYTYQNKKVRNWWEFVANFDKAMESSKSLTF